MHLHGERREAAGFLLPTEITFEPYQEDADIRLLSKRRRAIINAIEAADRILVYCLSLAPLDAELAQVITAGLELGRVVDIETVDPEHRRVARRLMSLVPTKRPNIHGRDPRDWGTVVRHTWPK
jgi:hypothetical protein